MDCLGGRSVDRGRGSGNSRSRRRSCCSLCACRPSRSRFLSSLLLLLRLLARHPDHAYPVRSAPRRSQEPPQRQAEEPADLGACGKPQNVARRSPGLTSDFPASRSQLHLPEGLEGPRRRPRVRESDHRRSRPRVGEAQPYHERALAEVSQFQGRLRRRPGPERVTRPRPRGLREDGIRMRRRCCGG